MSSLCQFWLRGWSEVVLTKDYYKTYEQYAQSKICSYQTKSSVRRERGEIM